jgi:hypothetical protein
MIRRIAFSILLVVSFPSVFAASPNIQVGGGGYQPNYQAPVYVAPGYPAYRSAPGVYNNPYYSSPYPAGVYRTPYGTTPVYGAPYVPATPYGYSNLAGGVPTPIGGNLFGITYGNGNLKFWRAPSGYYYPWVGGYNYSAYPILITPPGAASSAPAAPPISTVVSDLNGYLDDAKKNGKISQGDFMSLKRRGSDLLSKEKSLAYEQGGLDADQEADIRRDVEELSGEVARRVQP